MLASFITVQVIRVCKKWSTNNSVGSGRKGKEKLYVPKDWFCWVLF